MNDTGLHDANSVSARRGGSLCWFRNFTHARELRRVSLFRSAEQSLDFHSAKQSLNDGAPMQPTEHRTLSTPSVFFVNRQSASKDRSSAMRPSDC
jgi:hypothetical protein